MIDWFKHSSLPVLPMIKSQANLVERDDSPPSFEKFKIKQAKTVLSTLWSSNPPGPPRSALLSGGAHVRSEVLPLPVVG